MSEPRTALVVGAGIGGLAAALALQRAGWAVRVFERAHSPRELGFALLLAPNAMGALRELGLADDIQAGGVVATSGEMRRLDGTVLRRLDLSTLRLVLPEPTVMVLRPVLHGTLLDRVGTEALALDSQVTGFDADDSGVSVQVAGMGRVRGDVLIGADGVGSVVRRQLHPAEPPPRPSGLVAVRGVAHKVADLLGDASGYQYFGCGIEAGAARASGTAMYWYLSLPAAWAAGAADVAAVVSRALPEFHEPFRVMVRRTRAEDVRLDELFDRAPLATWGAGRVTLLGDAAHPMLRMPARAPHRRWRMRPHSGGLSRVGPIPWRRCASTSAAAPRGRDRLCSWRAETRDSDR